MIFSVRTEIVSLMDEMGSNLTYQTTNLDLEFPNSMLVNGIAVALDDALSCQKAELGIVNKKSCLYSDKILKFMFQKIPICCV